MAYSTSRQTTHSPKWPSPPKFPISWALPRVLDYCSLVGAALQLNKMVTSYGPITSRQGQVLATSVDVTLARNIFRDVILTQSISVPGDSGAPVLTSDHRLLGYIVGGDGATYSVVMPAHRIFPLKATIL